MVEQRTENPCVAGSIPVLATFLKSKIRQFYPWKILQVSKKVKN